MNKINVTASDLKTALAGFGKVVNRRTTLAALGCILFESKQGQLQLTATNLDDYVSTNVPCAQVPDVKALIPFDVLNKIVKGSAPVAGLEIVFGGTQARIRYPVASAVLTETIDCLPAEEFPAVPEPDWQEPVSVGAEFKQAIREAFESAGTDDTRYILNHVYVDVSDPNAHYVVGTSGWDLYAANSFQLGFKESLIVPNRSFLLWKGFMEDGAWGITLGTQLPTKKDQAEMGWIRIQSAKWTLITRKIEGVYPGWRAPIPSGDRSALVTFSEEARSFICLAAPRLPQSNEQNAPVTLINARNALVLSAGYGIHEASVPVTGADVAEGPLRIRMNRSYLIKAMKLGMTELEVYGDNPAIVFKNGGKRLVVAIMRDDSTPATTNPAAAPESARGAEPSADEAVTEKDEPEEQERTMKTTNRIESVTTETGPNGATRPQVAAPSAFEQLRAKLEALRDQHRSALTDIGESLKMLAQAQKERKTTEKEIEEVRETLQSLQKIRI